MPARPYTVRFVTHAEEQRRVLPAAAREALDLKVRQLEEDPRRDATERDGLWSSTFGNGFGIIFYVIGEQTITVTVLRLAWMSG
jgi:mRNA-degrading endonuclease RelE of RelBE toxin-antitoxin system